MSNDVSLSISLVILYLLVVLEIRQRRALERRVRQLEAPGQVTFPPHERTPFEGAKPRGGRPPRK